jgi:hypothetical protein
MQEVAAVWMRQPSGKKRCRGRRNECFCHFTRLKRGKEERVLLLKKFVFLVSVFERRLNWVSRRVRRSNWVSCFEICFHLVGCWVTVWS